MNLKQILFILFLLLSFSGFSQSRKIIIENSERLEVTEQYGPDVKIVVGDVRFSHDSALFFCDSAQYNSALNSLHAYGNIAIVRPYDNDTVRLFSDSAVYDGVTKIATAWNNVQLTKDSIILNTQLMNFDLNAHVAYYPNGAVTTNSKDTLISDLGYYYTRLNEFYFKKNVKLYNRPKYTILADTLKHHTKNKITYFLGPTKMYSDSTYIYCEDGTYNHNTEISNITKKAFIKNKDNTLWGDSLVYEKHKKSGKAYRNVKIANPKQKAELYGEYGMYDEYTKQSFLTGNALFKQIGKTDTMYLHADTLLAIPDTSSRKQLKDSTEFRIIRGFHKVKIFKQDIQAQCDSLVYAESDSLIKMFYQPVIWSKENQLFSRYIEMKMQDNELKKVYMKDSAYIITQIDSLRFNQIYGDNMEGFVDSNKLKRIEVTNNAQVIYFPLDRGMVIGINKIECKKMNIILINGKVENIWFYSTPKGSLLPPYFSAAEDLFLAGFRWYAANRPNSPEQLFIWNPKFLTEKEIIDDYKNKLEKSKEKLKDKPKDKPNEK